jgi:tRNA threonylcarbamoyladenosine biosynthesis protein TsaE
MAARILVLRDEAATLALGRALAERVRAGDVIALWGDLGAGKTTLARGLIRALPGHGRAPEDEEVPSPTFTLVQVYERRPAPVWHFDLYRLEAPDEAYELGLEEALSGAVTLIEWPERLQGHLPTDRLDVALDFADGGRIARLSGGSDWMVRLADLGEAAP